MKIKTITKSCSHHCWFAKRDKCTCICHGSNHKISERASEGLLEDMEKNYQEYKRLRREERKLLRAGLSPRSKSSSFMKHIIRIGKKT